MWVASSLNLILSLNLYCWQRCAIILAQDCELGPLVVATHLTSNCHYSALYYGCMESNDMHARLLPGLPIDLYWQYTSLVHYHFFSLPIWSI